MWKCLWSQQATETTSVLWVYQSANLYFPREFPAPFLEQDFKDDRYSFLETSLAVIKGTLFGWVGRGGCLTLGPRLRRRAAGLLLLPYSQPENAVPLLRLPQGSFMLVNIRDVFCRVTWMKWGVFQQRFLTVLSEINRMADGSQSCNQWDTVHFR